MKGSHPQSYLVTGGAGFIGSHIAEALVKRGETVRILDNCVTGQRARLDGLRVEWVEGDLRDPHVLARAVAGIECVFHEAALPSVPLSIKDPVHTHEVNATGTLLLLLACREARVRRVVYASSCAIYGDDPGLPKKEEMTPRPCSPYAATKLLGEYYCRIFSSVYRLETVCLRYFNVYGPGQDPSSPYAAVIPRFIQAMIREEEAIVYGDGLQSRDFIYIDDVVAGNLRAAETPGISGEIFNLASGRAVSLLELLTCLQRLEGRPIKKIFHDRRPGDILHSFASVEKARAQLGFDTQVGLDEGLQKTIDGFRQQAAGGTGRGR